MDGGRAFPSGFDEAELLEHAPGWEVPFPDAGPDAVDTHPGCPRQDALGSFGGVSPVVLGTEQLERELRFVAHALAAVDETAVPDRFPGVDPFHGEKRRGLSALDMRSDVVRVGAAGRVEPTVSGHSVVTFAPQVPEHGRVLDRLPAQAEARRLHLRDSGQVTHPRSLALIRPRAVMQRLGEEA